MKIHNVEITNIASLKGRHKIDFDAFQMDHGSFAITGDTGAGKSTILNCVALALYGKSYKSNLNQGDFITLGEASGKVELVFSCSGRKYLSVWGCRVRKKNGEYLKNPTHTKEFYLLTGERDGQADGKKVLETTPEDVIHLSFEQFCKTVILNQGEFAKFLTSSFRERKDILEKLYEGDKLDVFNPLLREKISGFAVSMDQIEAQMDGLGQGIQSDVTESGLETLEKSCSLKRDKYSFLEHTSENLRDICELEQKIAQTREKLAQLASKIQEQVLELNETTKRKSAFTKEHQDFMVKRQRLSPALHQAIERKNTLEKTAKKLKELHALKQKIDEEGQQASTRLAQVREDYSRANAQILELEADPLFKRLSEKNFEELKKIHQTYKDGLAKLDSLNTVFSHQKKSADAWRQEEENLNNELDLCLQQINECSQASEGEELERLEKKQFALQELQAKFASYQREVGSLEKDLETSRSQLSSRREVVGKLSSQYEASVRDIAIQKDAIRATHLEGAKYICLEESIEQNSCVVCSNDNISHLDLDSLGASQEKILAYESNLQRLERENGDLFQELERARTSQSALQASEAQAKEKLACLKGEFLSSNYALLHELNIIESGSLGSNIEETLINALEGARARIQKVKAAQMRLNALKQKENSLKERRASCALKRAETAKELEGSKVNIAQASQSLQSLETKAQNICALNSFQQTQSFIALIEKWLSSKRLLDTRAKEFEHQEERSKSLADRARDARKELSAAQKDALLLETQIKEASPDMDPASALSSLDKESEIFDVKKRHLDEEFKNLELEKSALYSRQQTFQEQLKDQENLILVHWGTLKESISAESAPDSAELKNVLNELAAQDAPCDGETLFFARELAQKEKNLSKERLDQARDELTEYKTILARQNSAKEKIKELRGQWDKTKILKEEWEELHLLIGKDEFRNYVLAMVEKLLIQQTNAELGKLCDGRYLIQHKQSSSRLAPDFYIIDKFRGDETRKVSTLSGGETFMVSLAMALALAELTRGNADIDSFFIDEGFGTLDHDSLDEALEMLQDIETRGKQIGLISHVKELTQRIPINIHLQKNRLGNSEIEIVYN